MTKLNIRTNFCYEQYSVYDYDYDYDYDIDIDIKYIIWDMNLTSQQFALTIVGFFKIGIFLVFLAIYSMRLHKINKFASNVEQFDPTLRFRIGGIIILIVLKLIRIMLAYLDPLFYLTPNPNFFLIDIIGMVDLLLQIILIFREINRKIIRSRYKLVALWAFMILIEVINIIIFVYYQMYQATTLSAIQIPVQTILIYLTFLRPSVKQPSLDDVEKGIKMSKLLPLIKKDSLSNQSRQSQKVYIQLNKQFKVSFQGDSFEFFFKIVVFIYGKHHVIEKSESQFIQLSQELVTLFPYSSVVSLNKLSSMVNSSNITKCGEQKQKMYELYLIDLTRTDQFFCQALLDFLQINKIQRQALQTLQRGKMSNFRQSSSGMNTTQKIKKRNFFLVTWKNLKIHVSNPQIIDIYINKTEDQIVEFHNKLISQRMLNVQFINERDDPTEFLNFIDRVVNSKKLWRVFSQWICLGFALEQKLYNMFDYWNYGFDKIQISIPSIQTSFDKSQSVIYYYLISVKNKANKKITVLKKRYNQFVKLDSNIRKYLLTENKKNIGTPNLPSKFSPFQSQTSPNIRRLYLDIYLKDLLKLQGINYCIKLLQFLQSDKELEQPQFIRKQDSEIQNGNQKLIDSFCLDQLEI